MGQSQDDPRPPASPRRRAVRSALVTAGLVMLGGVCAVTGLLYTSREAIREEIVFTLARIASIAAAQIDVEAHDAIRDPDQYASPQYNQTVAPIRQILSAAPDLAFVYTMVLDEQGQVRFILDGAEPGDADGDGVDDASYVWDIYEVDPEELINELLAEGKPFEAISDGVPYTDDWGTFISGYAPLIREDGTLAGVVGVDLRAERYLAKLHQATITAALGLIPTVCLAFGVGLIMYRAREKDARTTAQLVDARRAAEDSNRTKGEFLANMSHEIRTPMTAIMGNLDIFNEVVDETQQQECLSTIRRNGEHLMTVINDILDVSRLEAGRVSVEQIPLDLPNLLKDIAKLWQPRCEEKGIELVLDFKSVPPAGALHSDPIRLRQIVLNLVSNAVKFTPQGSVTVETTYDADGHAISLTVTDTGIGMTPEQLAAIRRAEAFTQADSSTTRRFGGTGLGFRISTMLIELLGGSMQITSEAGRGTRVSLTLPTRDPDALPEPESLPESAPVESTAAPPEALLPDALRGQRILLVEDGLDNQKLISFHLRKAGAEVSIADNGRLGLDHLSHPDHDQPDVVLLDMQMPEMDGYEAVAEIRARGMKVPVVAITAHAMAGDRHKCLDAGCDDYLTKPIDKAQLLSTCHRWCGLEQALA